MEDFVDIPFDDKDIFVIDEEDIKTNKVLDKTSDDLDELLAGLE